MTINRRVTRSSGVDINPPRSSRANRQGPATNSQHEIPSGADFQRCVAPAGYVSPNKMKSIYISLDSDDSDREGEGEEYGGDVVYIGTSPFRSINTSRASSTDAMVQDSAAGKAFKSLPIELHEHIAMYLPEDKDMYHYSLVCRKSGSAVTASAWRKRFLQKYDNIPDITPREIKQRYAYRKDVSRRWTSFDLTVYGGQITTAIKKVQAWSQGRLLIMLRDLILESNAFMAEDAKGNRIVQGLNLQVLIDLITGQNGCQYFDIVDSTFSTSLDADASTPSSLDYIYTTVEKGSLLYMVQLCLTPFALNPQHCHRMAHFDISQYHAYATKNCQPVFKGKYKEHVNVRWVLHVANFFKYHLKSVGEGLLAHDYKDLEPAQLPQFWTGVVKAGTQPLARHWKGAYLYMEPGVLTSLRNWRQSNGTVHTDSLDGDETFQDLDFFFDDAKYSNSDWPKEYDDILCSNPFPVPKNKAVGRCTRGSKVQGANMPEIKTFWGSCRGSRRGHFFGRIHAVPTQQGFHGFQRLTLMKYYTKVEAREHIYDPTQVYAYEGCVLPGGRIIIGRWWNARADPDYKSTNAGPFIWWNVDHSDAIVPIKEHEAFNFLDSFQDPIYVEDE